jgi:sugar phosphate isomerase/epimerase
LAKQISYGVVAAALSADAQEAAEAANRAGSSGLLFDAATRGLDLTELSITGRRHFRQILSRQNQQLIGLRADGGVKGLSLGADIDRVLWRWDKILETAAGLESPLVCLDLGPLPTPSVTAAPKPIATTEQAGLIILPTFSAPPAAPAPVQPFDSALADQVDAALAELGRRADRYGVTLALRSELAGFAALHRALAAANCPWFGVDLDPVAILRDEWPIDEIFSRLANFIRHVRGRDATAGADRRTQPATIGKGSTNWPALLALLDDAGFSGWITLDPMELTDRPAAAISGLHVLRQ